MNKLVKAILGNETMKKDEIIKTQKELNEILRDQIIQLTMISKIELGDDVIEEIKRLETILNKEDGYNRK